MVMSSHQISALAMQQQAMFGNAANYAMQITPPTGMAPGLGNYFGGYAAGPAPGLPAAPPPMPYYGMAPMGGGLGSMAGAAFYDMPGRYAQQGFSEQMLGTSLGALSTLGTGAANVAGIATTAAGVGTMFGIGGAGMAAAAGLPGMAVGAGLAATAYGANELYQGFRERQNVNRVMRQRFGGMMGVGSGRGGMGFSTQEMGQMSTMMREMAGQDMFMGFEELTRVLDRTSQMGLYRGVQSAREFRTKFKETVSTLKEIAQAMGTSLEGASQMMEAQRGMGFFSGQEITSSLLRTRLNAGATGFTIEQLQQIGQQGAQMGRAMGMRGRTGAGVMQETASNLAVGMRMGLISDEAVAEATGGLTGAAGAQAFAGRMMGVNQRWLRSGAGRVELAGLWDPESGGINRGLLQQVQSGTISIRELRRRGRRNIAQTGGNRSEFFRDRERLGGELMEAGGGDVMLGVLEEHYGRRRGLTLEDPILQRSLRRRLGVSQAQLELMIQQHRAAPQIAEERRVRNRQQIEQQGQMAARALTGFGGFRRRFQQMWEKEVEHPIRQAGDDLLTSTTAAIEGMFADMEGRVNTHMSEVAKQASIELASTGESTLLTGDIGGARARVAELRAQGYGADYGQTWSAKLGTWSGMRGPGIGATLKSMGAYQHGLSAGATRRQQVEFLTNAQRQMRSARRGLGLSASQRDAIEGRIEELVTASPSAAGMVPEQGLWGELTGAPVMNTAELTKKRIAFLQSKDAEFARLTRGKSFYEQAGILEEVSGRLTGRYQLPGMEGGVGRAQLVGENLAALEAREEEITSNIERVLGGGRAIAKGDIGKGGAFWGGGATALGIGSVLGGGPFGALAGVAGLQAGRATVSRITGVGALGDVRGFLGAAQENRVLYEHVQALAGVGGGDISRTQAIARLRSLAEGGVTGGPLRGVELSAEQRKAARALANAAEKNAEGTQNVLKEYIQNESDRTLMHSLRRTAKTGRDLRAYVEEHRGAFEENVEGPALEEFQELVRMRSEVDTKGGASADEVWSKEREFLMKYGTTESGRNLLTMLDRDESGRGVYMATALRGVQQYTRGLLNVNHTERGRRSLAKALQRVGITGGLRSLEKRKGGQQRLISQIESGNITTEDLMKRLREAGALRGLKGITTAEVERELGAEVELIHGKLTKEEVMKRGTELGMRRAQQQRISGAQNQMQDLPALAKQQVKHLEKLVGLTTTIAANAGNEGMINAIKGIFGNDNNSPGGNTVDAGGSTT